MTPGTCLSHGSAESSFLGQRRGKPNYPWPLALPSASQAPMDPQHHPLNLSVPWSPALGPGCCSCLGGCEFRVGFFFMNPDHEGLGDCGTLPGDSRSELEVCPQPGRGRSGLSLGFGGCTDPCCQRLNTRRAERAAESCCLPKGTQLPRTRADMRGRLPMSVEYGVGWGLCFGPSRGLVALRGPL